MSESNRDVIKDFFLGRSKKYDIYMNELQKAENNSDPASKGTLAKICNTLLQDLKQDNDFIRTLVEHGAKTDKDNNEFREFLLTNNFAIQFILRKLDNIESNSKEKDEIDDIRTRLSNVESDNKRHKPIIEGIEEYTNQVKEAQKNQKPAPVADYIK
jgi:GTP-binding protein EngB required for normal cell division